MARTNVLLFAMNRGEVSTLLLARTDLEHLRLAAQIQQNWLPRVLGPMSMRPGSAHLGSVFQNLPAKFIAFCAAFGDTAEIELTANLARFWVDDALVARAPVTTTVAGFGSSGSWATASTGTATISVSGAGLVIANLNQGAFATATQTVAIAPQDQATEHAIRVTVTNGPVILRIGTAVGHQDVFADETLDTGVYSMAFTPGAPTVYIQFASTINPENFNTLTQSQAQGLQSVTVASIALEASGVLMLSTPWPGSVIGPPSLIRSTPSADVIFVACPGVPQYQINRYSPTSWSIVLYKPVKGPMDAVVGDSSIMLTPSVVSGDGTLSASQPLFQPGDVGTLWRIFQTGQTISQTISFSDTYTDTIRVTGVSVVSTVVGGSIVDTATTDRDFTFQIAGTWAGTINLERSYESPTTGFTVYQSFTGNTGPTTVTDGLNNEIIWYRLGPAAGQLASGNAVCTLIYPGGGGAGIAHVTAVTSPTLATIEILVPFYSTSGATDWHQTEWSGEAGYPTSCAIHEGRLWWAGSDRWWGSTSDDYTNFDFDAIGDAAYIDVSVGQGPIAQINWLLSLDNLLGGADTSVITARSDAIQSPLTPTNFNLRFSTTTGSAPVQAIKIDNRAIYVDQSTRKIFLATYDLYSYNYKTSELSNLNPDIGFLGYVEMAIQRNPDTRLLLIREDGQIVSLVYDEQDEVKAFWRVVTPGIYEDILVQPGKSEDQVYVLVNRGGQRFFEKFARIDECVGAAMNKIADCHFAYSGIPTAQISMPWLPDREVVCWADGIDVGPIQLDNSGNATLPVAAANICAGLGYDAEFLSAKLAYAAQGGTAINQMKRVDHIGFVLQNTHYRALRFGTLKLGPFVGAGNQPTSENSGLWDEGEPLDPMPETELGAKVPQNAVWAYYDQKMIEFPADADPDLRLCIKCTAPLPATVLAVTLSIETAG